MTGREAVRLGWRLVRRAGWAPILVFLLHVLIARVLDGYINFPPLDIPMHLAGGWAMAYFLSECFAALPEGFIAPGGRKAVEAVMVLNLTTVTAVLWEFAEFLSDQWLGSQAQVGLEDTLLDLALGMVGAVGYVGLALLRGTLGQAKPVEAKPVEAESGESAGR